ncbi:hypothetical protein GCM10009584_31330 [Ornithinimicrobium humiphilum]|uniref:Uncharacterized protein n=1 Tax=Ornithinimicrobium humiphilum TaxID=125288 RepID=A0A543K5F1_9MICO|nr:hypothetical protein [Ornithinimicrobium humiphilum]TQM90302.1 hypothetical protein FB476_3255 [Ornithinimicrobium humiphilum]
MSAHDDLRAWLWAPLGEPGLAAMVDGLPPIERHASRPGPLRQQHRCSLTLGGRAVSVDWRGVPMVASVDGEAAVASELCHGTGPGGIVWSYPVSSATVLDEPVTTERAELRRTGLRRLPGAASPWLLAVEGPGGRAWTWEAAGGPVFADRVELRRSGEQDPVVTHLLRPVPGRPRGGDEAEGRVIWTADAVPAEVLLDVLWVLQEVWSGILPKAQRVARADVL